MWSSQHRMNNIISISSQIDWNSTWLYLNNNTKCTNNYTNFQLNQSKSFKVKLLLNTLPTLFHFHKLYPQLINNANCITCNSLEHPFHWLTCPNTVNLSKVISESIITTITYRTLDISSIQLQELQYQLTQHSSLSLNNIQIQQTNIYTTIQEYIPKDIISTIQPYTTSRKEALSITIKLLLKLSNNIYEQIWKPYCAKLVQ